jgi:ubiquinone/menaquinone biosynthesis C-methylase UbiE
MGLRSYEFLSSVYDLDWGDFSMQYVEIIQQLLERKKIGNAKILDLACGTGTLIAALLKRGHACFGIDRSPEMIAIAEEKVKHYSHVDFAIQDMQYLKLQESFDIATCTFDSLNYLTDIESVGNLFISTASALDDGGLFIFDSNTRHMYMNHSGFSHAYEFGKIRLVQRMHYDVKDNIAETVFEFMDGSRELHRQRPYGLKELKPILKRTGFSIDSTFGGFRGRKYNRNCERLICVAVKKAV